MSAAARRVGRRVCGMVAAAVAVLFAGTVALRLPAAPPPPTDAGADSEKLLFGFEKEDAEKVAAAQPGRNINLALKVLESGAVQLQVRSSTVERTSWDSTTTAA